MVPRRQVESYGKNTLDDQRQPHDMSTYYCDGQNYTRQVLANVSIHVGLRRNLFNKTLDYRGELACLTASIDMASLKFTSPRLSSCQKTKHMLRGHWVRGAFIEAPAGRSTPFSIDVLLKSFLRENL